MLKSYWDGFICDKSNKLSWSAKIATLQVYLCFLFFLFCLENLLTAHLHAGRRAGHLVCPSFSAHRSEHLPDKTWPFFLLSQQLARQNLAIFLAFSTCQWKLDHLSCSLSQLAKQNLAICLAFSLNLPDKTWPFFFPSLNLPDKTWPFFLLSQNLAIFLAIQNLAIFLISQLITITLCRSLWSSCDVHSGLSYCTQSPHWARMARAPCW